jgi:tripartite-type tricarboxylate transporter receptor subunit TctC
MTQIDRRAVLRLASATAVLTAGFAWSQSPYPNRPIRLVVPFGPGSFTDVVTREVATRVSAALGQPFVIENKPGANTGIATELVSRATPDGYTLLIGTVGGMAANPAGMMRTVPYDVSKNFTPISHIGSVVYAVLANPSIPAKNMEELIQYARQKPGLKYGSGNFGGLVYMSMLARTQKLDLLNVPYKSGPPALMDLVGGVVDMMVTDLNSALPLQKTGKLNILAIAGSRRSPHAPGVPTLKEAGVNGVRDVPGWIGLYGPANLPPHIVATLNKELNTVLQLPAMQAKAASVGLDIQGSTPEGLASYTREQTALWKELIAEFKMAPQD